MRFLHQLLRLNAFDYMWSTTPTIKCVQIQTMLSRGLSGKIKFSQDKDLLLRSDLHFTTHVQTKGFRHKSIIRPAKKEEAKPPGQVIALQFINVLKETISG